MGLLGVLAAASPANAQPDRGNSANAKACQKGGWQYLVSIVDGTEVPFAGEEACVSFAAKGGTLAQGSFRVSIAPGILDDPRYLFSFPGSTFPVTQTFTVTNVGVVPNRVPLSIFENFDPTGDYVLSEDACSGQTLAPQTSCTFAVTKTAASQGGTAVYLVELTDAGRTIVGRLWTF